MHAFRPILPSPRYISGCEIEADAEGNPSLEHRLFLLDPRKGEAEIKRDMPTLWAYLEEGKALGLHERYLCSHRTLWYAQENRPTVAAGEPPATSGGVFNAATTTHSDSLLELRSPNHESPEALRARTH
jgi:hypothetical protein